MVEAGLTMGTIHVNLIIVSDFSGMDAQGSGRETHEALLGVPGTGPTGARSRSQ